MTRSTDPFYSLTKRVRNINLGKKKAVPKPKSPTKKTAAPKKVPKKSALTDLEAQLQH